MTFRRAALPIAAAVLCTSVLAQQTPPPAGQAAQAVPGAVAPLTGAPLRVLPRGSGCGGPAGRGTPA